MPGQSVPASLYSAANPNDLDPWSIFTAKQGGAPATPPRNSSLDFTQSASLGTPPPASCRRFLSRICAHVHGDRQRTRWPPATRAQFDALRGPTGALLIGAAETIRGEDTVRERSSRRPFSNYVPNGCLGSPSRENVEVDRATGNPRCSNPPERTHHCLFALAKT